ncbi:MAG TPA: hypothetical protein VFP32_03285 [Candidatus Saccharimonadales bacterium]|nr:hypothetical protein [Candidatus Saccharimonadales bacterium]
MKRSKSIIAVDIDDVLVPHAESLINWYNQKYGTKLTLAHNHSKDPKPWGTKTVEEAIKRVHEYIHSAALFKAKPMRESINVLKELSQTYELAIITGRDTIIEEETRRWLARYYPELFKSTHFTAIYNLEGKARSKADVCSQAEAAYLIDDSLDQAIEVSKRGVMVLLFGDYPWNQAKRLPKGITRVKNWQEVLEYFDGQAR